MKLLYKRDHYSIKHFNPVTLDDFSVITGPNGSGKTHLLIAIRLGEIEIAGINSAEVIYYDNSDFTISKSDKNVPYSRLNAQAYLHQINNRILDVIHGLYDLPLIEEFITRTKYHSYSEEAFKEIFCKQENNELIAQLIKSPRPSILINSIESGSNPAFYRFVTDYLRTANSHVEDLVPDKLINAYRSVRQKILNAFISNYEDVYQNINSLTRGKDIFSLHDSDFEQPNFLFTEIENEEKEYQLLKATNVFKLSQAKELGADIEYIEVSEFEKRHGKSPVERINEVLEKYDCNGYRIEASFIPWEFGVDVNNMNTTITLWKNDGNYKTDFDLLSSGEKTLMALALLIYKTRKKKILPRLLLLDEIDAFLHPINTQRLLRVLKEVFVEMYNIKILLVTHSPTTIAFSPSNSIFVMDSSKDDILKKVDQNEALNMLTEGFATLNNDEALGSIQYNISKTDQPVLFTEGITDKIIIETAWQKLGKNKEMPFYVQDCFDASFLRNMFSRGDQKDGIFVNYPDRTLIALFDFDDAGYNAWNNLKNGKFNNGVEINPMKCLTITNDQNGYVLLLPVPPNPTIQEQAIYDGEILKRGLALSIELLFYGIEELNHFFKIENGAGGGKIITIPDNEKRKFAKKTKDLDKKNFTVFNPLFDKLEEIIANHSKAN